MRADEFLKLTREEQGSVIQAMRLDKELYARFILPHIVTSVPEFHKPVYKSMNDMAQRKYRYGAYVLYRGAAKSTLSKTIGVSHDAVFGIEPFVLLISESIDQASKDLISIQDEMENNEMIQLLMGNPKGSVWNQEECECSNGVFIKCKGYSSRIRGIKWKSMRPSKISLDDFESESNTGTRYQREQVINWIIAQVLPCGNENPIYQFFGTIVHPEAWLAKVHEMSYFQPPRGFFYRVDIEKDGVPSWPERYPMSYIEEKRELAKEQKKYSLFLQEYYNIPWSGGVPIFDSGKITVLDGARFDKYENITYLAYQGKKKLINVFIGVDPARSVRDDADDTCFFVLGVLPDGHYVILEVVTAKIKPSDQVKQLFELADKYRPRHVEIEVNAYQFALADWCRQTMNATPGISFAIEEYTSSQSKNAKYIAGLEPIINTGKITRLGYCPGWEKLKEEMDRFDGERKDNSDNTLDGAFLALDQAYAPADRNVDDLIAARKLNKGSSPKKRLNWMTI